MSLALRRCYCCCCCCCCRCWCCGLLFGKFLFQSKFFQSSQGLFAKVRLSNKDTSIWTAREITMTLNGSVILSESYGSASQPNAHPIVAFGKFHRTQESYYAVQLFRFLFHVDDIVYLKWRHFVSYRYRLLPTANASQRFDSFCESSRVLYYLVLLQGNTVLPGIIQ